MTAPCSYLYGVIPVDLPACGEQAGGPKSFGPIGLDGGEVRAVAEDGIAMLAGPAGGVDFSRLGTAKALQHLAEHQRVLEQVSAEVSVIPVKFGTVAADDAEIVGILSSGKAEFTRALARLGGKVEMDMAAFWVDLRAVLAEIADEGPVAAMKAEITGGRKPTVAQGVRLGQLVKKLLDQKRENVAARLVVALRAQWPDVIVNPTQDDSMILSAAILIDRSQEAQFDQTIGQLNGAYENRLNFRCVGPLPAYSFATTEVQTVDADVLDAARKTLELGESASLDEIKAAYRRLLREYHPDRNPDPGAGERVKEIAGAYELLKKCALNCGPASEPTGGHGATFVRIRSLPELRAELGTPAGTPASRAA